ncbi:hypothetical protein BSLG_002125 [Batrachochytrium salamandrivorans]|nr:hypothetical protein BASA83_003513 [Batrachochytrium salamandrivorans]KAJ1343099.1 hypothetical protein BSLG_002125 [Batrachochytrium salamandrivorans]
MDKKKGLVDGLLSMDRAADSASSFSSTSSLSSARPRKDILELKNEIGPKYIILMVGLPARGKSYICKKLCRYLSWSGFNTKVFNVGNRRRVLTSNEIAAFEPSTSPSAACEPHFADGAGSHPTFAKHKRLQAISEGDVSPGFIPVTHSGIVPLRTAPQFVVSSPVVHPAIGVTPHDANFFDNTNSDAKAIRERLALDTLDELISWLRQGGKVAIHDATNSTVERRRSLLERVEKESGIRALFIESICPDPIVLEKNIQMKLNGPDYKFMDPEVAINDFKARISNYEKVYQTISEEEEQREVSYIKIINVGQKVIANRIRGYLPSQCVFYLMQMHIHQRTIWLTRHGESEYNISERIGGDPALTLLGKRYSCALAKFMKRSCPPKPRDISPASSFESTQPPTLKYETVDTRAVSTTPDPTSMIDISERNTPLSVFTSTLQRTMAVADYFDQDEYEINNVRFLNEIYAGSLEGLTYAEVELHHPVEFAARKRNKLLYRYPGSGGESYIDVIERLRPVIIELERMQSDALVVTHQVVMRTLLSYFLGIPLQDMPTMSVPLHTLYCLKPQPYGTDVTRYTYDPELDDFVYAGSGYTP